MAEDLAAVLSAVDSTWLRLLDETTMRLRLVGALQRGNRLNTRLHYVYRNVWHARLYRSLLYTETREHSVAYVRGAVDNLGAFVVAAAHGQIHLPDDVSAVLLDVIDAAVGGVANLIHTYAEDVASCSALSNLVARMAMLRACLVATRDKTGARKPGAVNVNAGVWVDELRIGLAGALR
jgi:hypothetical protein